MGALKYYNKSTTCRTDDKIDYDFVQLLLVSFVHLDDLRESNIDDDVLNLVKGILFRI